MAGQGQQMPSQGQQMIMMRQTPGSGRRGRHQAMMERGTHLCGYHIKGPCIIAVTVVGVILTLVSLNGFRPALMMMHFNNGTFLIFPIVGLLVSVTCLVTGCCAGCKAKREWDALPMDHPDRIKYSGVAALTVPIQQQPGGNVPPSNYPQPSPGGYNQPPSGAYNQPPSGAYNPPPFDYNQPQPGPYNQPPGNYNQPPSGAYNPPPFDYNQPQPGPYNQPPSGVGFGNYSYQSGQPLPPGQPGASPIKYHFQGPAESASAPPPPGADDLPPSYDQIKT